MSDAEALIARHLDGTADAAEAAALDRLLREDPAVARAFARAAAVDADLRRLHRAADPAAPADGSITARIAVAERQAAVRSARRRVPRRRGRIVRFPLLAAAAAVLLALGATVWLATAGGAPAAPFSADGRPLAAGTPLSGTVGVAGGGSAVLSSGAEAVAAGDAREPVLRLGRGTVRCTVEPRPAGGFRVATPHGEVRVIGTVFSVAVDGSTRLTVERGVVEAVAGGGAVRVSAGGAALLAAGRSPTLFQDVSRLLPTGDASAWNNSSPGAQVRSEGTGPTGLPAQHLDLTARPALWASCLWRPGVDWRAQEGVSLVLEGKGTGERLQLEIMDNGPDQVAGRRDAYERFIVDFRDDIAGWHERRFPFTAFQRRKDLWPGMPDDGFGRAEVHGFALIAVDLWQGRVERLGLYAKQ